MTADLLFPNVELFGTPSGQRVRVRVGEMFRISLKDIGEEPIDWATTKDRVLKVDDNAGDAVVLAEKVGASEVQIQRDRQVVHYITVEVFSTEAAGFKAPAPVIEPL
jgi:hypothetical protein